MPIFYAPPILWFAEFLDENNEVILEQWETFPKQTYRNRMCIYGANGKLTLVIPIEHSENKTFNKINVSHAEKWEARHWKSIVSAYRRSPYFEYYQDYFVKLFEESCDTLLEFNLKFIETVLKILKNNKTFQLTTEFEHHPEGLVDLRDSFSAKKETTEEWPHYYQTFEEKHGFIKNLSILDLIFNIGPESATYLKKLKSK